MSGHSKWAKIKRQKGANDVKRGAIFTKLGRNIVLAVKEGGPDPDSNFSLRLVIDKAKAVNMPADNIERSIKKATGEDAKVSMQKVTYEAITSNGVNILVDCQTDNTNRTVAEVKKILESNGAKMASIGSVSWQFTELGLIIVEPARLQKSQKFGTEDTYIPAEIEEIEMELMEIEGITDINQTEIENEKEEPISVLEVFTDKINFSKVHKKLVLGNYKIITAELIKKPNDLIEITDEVFMKVDKIVEALEEHDDVDSVWTNTK